MWPVNQKYRMGEQIDDAWAHGVTGVVGAIEDAAAP